MKLQHFTICFALLLTLPAAAQDEQRGFSHPRNGSTADQTGTVGKYYGLIMGVKKYTEPGVDQLPHALDDATALYNALKQDYVFDSLSLLPNPRRGDIIKAMAGLKRIMTDRDNLLIFYAGHGYEDMANAQGYWWPSDAETDNPANWISNSDIIDGLNSIPFMHAVLITDACFSGGIITSSRAAHIDDADIDIQMLYDSRSCTAMTSGAHTVVPDNSVFIKGLLTSLKTNNLKFKSARSIFNGFFQDALRNTKDKTLIPQYDVVLNAPTKNQGGDFIFVRKEGVNNGQLTDPAASVASYSSTKTGDVERGYHPDKSPDVSLHKAQAPGPFPRMLSIQGGNFEMGSNDGGMDERPVRAVHVSNFNIGECEVTVGQFRNFMKAKKYFTTAEKLGSSIVWNGRSWVEQESVTWECDALGRKRTAAGDDDPVIHVSWDDAIKYCEWLSQKTGKKYRLPTEAEWEYAAKGGNRSSGYKYSGGNNLVYSAWYKNNSNNSPHAVGQLAPNEVGLYDMSGNVWEWCSDGYDPGYYSSENNVDNPKGPDKAEDFKVLRGGGWDNSENYFRLSLRNRNSPLYRSYNVGFRVVCEQ